MQNLFLISLFLFSYSCLFLYFCAIYILHKYLHLIFIQPSWISWMYFKISAHVWRPLFVLSFYTILLILSSPLSHTFIFFCCVILKSFLHIYVIGDWEIIQVQTGFQYVIPDFHSDSRCDVQYLHNVTFRLEVGCIECREIIIECREII